jgi:localization factor PodJL
MNSRVSWSVDGIDPSVRERAEAAARRAGMSLNDWLSSTLGSSFGPSLGSSPGSSLGSPLGDSTPSNSRNPQPPLREVADVHQRLDSIARQIEQIARPLPRNDAVRDEGVARQLNDAISRLDARLSQISTQAPKAQDKQRQAEDLVERVANQIYRASPPLSPASLDSTVAEIAARQSELDNPTPRAVPPRSAPPIVPTASPGPDFSALERHLVKITSQIEALQRPDVIEQSIAAFRNELAEIRVAITEAMPRRAIETIENEVRSLSRRIDDSRQSAIDAQALSSIERALSEIREVLGSLTPAEQLAGYDEAIRNLGAKLDTILRANDDPSTVKQLESAISALRGIVSNVASNDALARLSEDVHLLSSKVDQLTRAGHSNDSLALLEQRIASLTSALESRERPVTSDATSEHLEIALRALSDRIDRLQVGNDGAAALAHLEQRVTYLLERLEASSDGRTGHLGRVEDGLQDILRHLENHQTAFTQFAETSRLTAPLQTPQPQPQDTGLIDLVKRELTDIRFSQTEAGRHTQDSLEAVHNTLGHVVDRLAMIEGDLRTARVAPAQPPAPSAPPPPQPAPLQPAPEAIAPPVTMAPPEPKPELPNPAAAQPSFEAAPRDFHAANTPAPPPLMPPLPPRAISEILEPHAAKAARAALEPDLPPDHPLEPGTRPNGRLPSPSERIAASESAISEIPAAARQPVSSSSFIAAARRAAQAAAAAPPPEKAGRAAKAVATGDTDKEPSTLTAKIRSVLVAASVVVIVLGTFKMAMTLLEGGGSPPPVPAAENTTEQAPAAKPSTDGGDKPATPGQVTPSMTSPTPLGRQSLNNFQPSAPDTAASADISQSGDITGAIPSPQATNVRKFGTVQVPPTERLPDAIGGPVLRAAALKGDATAAYEIATRFADGKGVPQNYDEAAKWFDRAAQAGVVPAVFRLGTFYEKGLSVKKDVDIARRYYLQAAERGNAKAMHNLAVLDADGGGKGANYKSAAQWFRKAADRGVADSQFNLGILYARGIGVEQNLAESFKWFSLAAAQGDADAANKRDDVAKRMDAQSLAAAKLAIQTFTAEPQPEDAVIVATPPGGWDSSSTQTTSAKPVVKPLGPIKRASR